MLRTMLPCPPSSPMEALFSLSAPSSPFWFSSFPSKPPKSNPSALSFVRHDKRSNHLFPSRRPASARVHCAVSSAAVTLPDAEEAGEFTGGDEKFEWYAQWYPVAPLCDLDKRAPQGKRVMGLDVVVWWDRNGNRWQVFDDRCPHRLAPLSEGRIDRWGRLQCVYHGWCFDGNGACQLIPQAPPDAPPVHTSYKACAAVYPSLEQNKILWFWPSTDPQYKDIQMKKRPPYIPEVDDPSYTSTFGMRDLPYGYEVLIENLMDPAHIHYAHYGIMRVPKRKVSLIRYFCVTDSKIKFTDREGGYPLDISIETLDILGFVAKQKFVCTKFIAPCVLYNYPRWGSQNIQAESPATVNQKQRSFLLVFICTPVSPGRSRVLWVFPRNFALWADKIIPRWIFHVGQNLILDSDLYLLHVEEQKIMEAGPSNWQKACFVPTKSDAMVIAFRKWLKKYSNSKIDWGTKFNGYLPPTPPKKELMDRYWSHTLHCGSCRVAVKGLKALEVFLQVISVALIGIAAAARWILIPSITRSVVVSMAVVCFLASRWFSHFIYKSFYFHDYNHAFR